MIQIARTAEGFTLRCEDEDYCNLVAQAMCAIDHVPALRRGSLAGLLEEHGKLFRSLPTADCRLPNADPLIITGQGDYEQTWPERLRPWSRESGWAIRELAGAPDGAAPALA